MNVALSAGRDDESVAAFLAVRASVVPPLARTLAEYAHELGRDPGACVLVARRSGELVGAADIARRLDRGPDSAHIAAAAYVPRPHRRAGIGSSLYAALSQRARALGGEIIDVEAWEGDPDGIAWATRRGFEITNRAQAVALALDGETPPAVDPPAGITIVSLAERPGLIDELYRLAGDVLPDRIRAGLSPRGDDFERWRADRVDAPGLVRSAYLIALNGGEAVGYACLALSEARPGVALHDMTGVAPAWRGRGIAGALKRAQIAWAIRSGLHSLEAENHDSNAPMQAINRRLGYVRLPGWVELEGPLQTGMT